VRIRYVWIWREEVLSEDFFFLWYEVKRQLLLEDGLDEDKLGNLRRVMKVCYKNCGDWERAVFQDKSVKRLLSRALSEISIYTFIIFF